MVKSREEIFSLVNKIFEEDNIFQVKSTPREIVIRKVENVVEKTKGTIKNLDLKIIKMIAENEEFR
ncbi:hypothetical protein KKH56_02645 [bacterium]|nr:hypothetical protein [bacterium]